MKHKTTLRRTQGTTKYSRCYTVWTEALSWEDCN